MKSTIWLEVMAIRSPVGLLAGSFQCAAENVIAPPQAYWMTVGDGVALSHEVPAGALQPPYPGSA